MGHWNKKRAQSILVEVLKSLSRKSPRENKDTKTTVKDGGGGGWEIRRGSGRFEGQGNFW